jgi:hypothetical protein
MKKFTLFLHTFLLAVSLSHAQSSDAMKELFRPAWKVGKVKVFDGHAVLRQEGKNDYFGFTNILYTSHDQIKAAFEKRAQQEMWTQEKKKEKMELLTEVKGGMITLYLGRRSIERANTKNFTVIVKDAKGDEILREELNPKVADRPDRAGSYWTNNSGIGFTKEVKMPLTVYVVDKLGPDDNKKTVFVIKN